MFSTPQSFLIMKRQLISILNITRKIMKPSNTTKDIQASKMKVDKRKNHINRIRSSLLNVPIFRQNISLASKKMSERQTQTGSDSASKMNSSPSKFGQNAIEDFQLFEQKYQILNKLGEGSNGVVKKCRKKQTAQLFAVKSFSFQEQHLPGLKSNFLVMKRLNHPNIIKYEALYIDLRKRMGWLVMELINYPSLNKAQLRSEGQIKKVMFQLMEALSYLHNLDVVHRDIKPENIMYDSHTQKIKLIDFGISKRFRRRGSLHDMWTITGTLFYRAPEMFSGGYRQGVDVWAAGALLYKLVTGKTPFQSEYHYKTIQNIRQAQLQFPIIFNQYSNGLKMLVGKMLHRNTEERITASGCLSCSWFSQLNATSNKRKNILNQQTFQPVIKNKMKMSAMLSLKSDKDDSQAPNQLNDSPLEKIVRPYVRKINGKEYHCIDSEWILY